jgi:hypothetical protein
MRRMIRSIICLSGVIAATAICCQAKEWRGLKPLHSSRSAVERVLGPASGECKCHHETEAEFVRVEYAKGPCDGYPPGWNVPAGTVLSISVRTKAEHRFSDLRLDFSKYVMSMDDTFTTYYASREEGVQYVVQNERITSVSYIPMTTDQRLRCPGFPAEDGTLTVYPRLDTYPDLSFCDEMARLDNLAIELQNGADWKGYIVVYAGRRARPTEAKKRAERARSYIIRRRGLTPERVVAIDGGYREEFGVELYLIHKDHHAPYPWPTVSTRDVQVIKTAKREREDCRW